jgi:hypothetical protein
LRSATDRYHRFLCHCFRSDHAAAREFARAPGWIWERLFQSANDESVLPALAFAVHEGLDISAPCDVADFLSAVLSLNRERNQRIWQELRMTVELLNEVGIEPVLLKGAAYFAAGVYSDPGARYLVDLDLLVPEAQLNDGFQHLVENGFSYDKQDQFGQFRHHHPPLQRASVPFELHHRLGFGPCASILSASELIESATLVEFDGLQVRVPSPTHQVTHLVMHSQIHHPYNERIWPPLRAMLDLARLQFHYGCSIDWAEVDHRFENAGQGDRLRLHLIDVREALNIELPIKCTFTPVTHLRSVRRLFLRRFPALRYCDPIYMFSAACLRRLRIVRSVLAARGGLKCLGRQLLALRVYERFFTDIVEGRGR